MGQLKIVMGLWKDKIMVLFSSTIALMAGCWCTLSNSHFLISFVSAPLVLTAEVARVLELGVPGTVKQARFFLDTLLEGLPVGDYIKVA